MNDKERRGQLSPGKPFTLRPSTLSSSPRESESSSQVSNKLSLLRPSPLTAIADKIESSTSDVKKRKAEKEDTDGLGVDTGEGSKKSKVQHENQSGSSKLADTLTPPKGIGTFGFIKYDESNQNDANSKKSSVDTAESYGFIFGEHVKDVVTGFEDISNMTSSNLGADDKGATSVSGKEQKQRLADNAIKHMKKEKLAKIHLTEIEVVTGEEGERNVLQIQCKLHLFCQNKSTWIEKGKGTFKLNDICKSEKYDIFQSRIVFRRQGSNQVVLNTLLWPEMCYDKAGSKSLRLTALDADTEKIHIYLVTGSTRDIAQLHTAIDRRVSALKRNKTEEVSDSAGNDHCNGEIDQEVCQPAESSPIDPPSTENVIIDDEKNERSCDSGNSNDSITLKT